MTFVRLSLIITALLLSCFSYAQTSIWQVSNDKNTVYLGGTFHMLKPSDSPLPQEFEHIYKKVNWLVFETDISKLDSTEFETKFMKTMSLPSGQILADQLSPQAYSGLIHYAAKNGIDTGHWQRFKPQMVCLMISLQELNKLGLTAQGVEQYLGDKALLEGKKITELETIDEQIHYVATMGQGNETALIMQTLEDLKTLPNDLDTMSTAWRTGDVQSLFNTGIQPMMENYPEVYRSLLVERNNNWLPRIEQLIKQPDEKFILVGALHLIGEDGLLQQLAQRGYQVQPFSLQH
tara:strand:- start:932 stop:1807 length:876 start_codon:yes stop_codon:yes gene_type:complete